MNLWKKLPQEFGGRKVAVTTRSYRRYWTHSLASIHGDLFAAVNHWVKPGAVVWDIGANLGLFAISAAIRAGRDGHVYAFEADVEMAAMITRSNAAKTSADAEVCVCPWAVGAHEGEAEFVVSGYRSAASALAGHGRFGVNGRDQSRIVTLRTVDDMARSLRPPNILKIDVEGAENLVMNGADNTIRSLQPLVLVEASGGESGTRTAEILRSWNYVWRSWRDQTAWQSAVSSLDGDLVAVPEGQT